MCQAGSKTGDQPQASLLAGASAVPEPGFEQVTAQIRFHLDELSSLNEHHRFEDLSRQFARARIAPNILPATGPVGAGGDRGRDFETFRSFMRDELGPYGGFAGALSNGKALAFICTLQRESIRSKLLGDVAKIAAYGTEVAAVYAFLVVPFDKAKRSDLQEEVKRRHGFHLEILDRGALAEALVDREVFWIAEEYLSIPAALRPQWPSDDVQLPEWYEADRKRWRARGAVGPRLGELLDVTDGLRYATKHPEARADLPFWLDLVRALDREGVPARVRQRARYEFAAAQVRGLGDLRPAEDAAIAYLRDVVAEDDPARLDDAANLLSYATAAVWYGLSDLDLAELSELNARLRARIRELLNEAPRTRRARLLEVLGRIAIMPDPLTAEAGSSPTPALSLPAVLDAATDEDMAPRVAALPSVDIEEAVWAWSELAGALDDTPLYPVGQLARLLEYFAPLLLQWPEWEAIEHAVDEAVERVEGGDAAGERARVRALRLIEADRLLPALAELHRAIVRWWSGDDLRPALMLMLGVSDIYERLQLPQAAKHYALAAAVAAHSSSDDSVADLLPHGILRASQVDYAAGRWLSALEYVDVGLLAQSVLVDADVGQWVESDTNDSVITIGMALLAAEQLVPEVLPRVRAVAEKHGMLANLDNGLKGARRWGQSEWVKLADEQLSGRPFNDLGVEALFRFRALGTSWTIRADAAYPTARGAERLAAAAQIVLAELAADDLCLLPAEIEIHVVTEHVASDNRVVRDHTASNWRFRVALVPRGRPIDESDHFSETLTTLVLVLSAVSALPDRECMGRVAAAFERGLGQKLALGRPFEELADLVPEARYDLELRRRIRPPLADSAPAPPEHMELAWQDGPGPTYSEERAREALRRRYDSLPAHSAYTLGRLRGDEAFKATLAELRQRGWRDWHVLTAITNIVANARLEREGLNTAGALRCSEAVKRVSELMWQPERVDDPQLPVERFDVRAMEFARRGAVPAYAKAWDLHLAAIPDFEALDRFLAVRYRYWDDDVDHADPFAED